MSEGAGSYRLMRYERLSESGFEFRAVEPSDIEDIRLWRNDQMNLLRQSSAISRAEQSQYFSTHVWPEKSKQQPSQVLLAIERDGNLIGYGGLVNISWPNRRAEISFLLDPMLEQCHEERTAAFRAFLSMVKALAFDEFHLYRLFTETFANRQGHIETLEAAGFQREGRMQKHVVVDGSPVDSLLHGCLATGALEWR